MQPTFPQGLRVTLTPICVHFFICSQRTHDLKEGWRTLSRSNLEWLLLRGGLSGTNNSVLKSLPCKHNPPSHFWLLLWPFNHHMMTVWDNSAQIYTNPMVQTPNCLHEAEDAQLPLTETPWPGFWITECADDASSDLQILTAKVVVAKRFNLGPLDVCCLTYRTDSSALIKRLLQCAN